MDVRIPKYFLECIRNALNPGNMQEILTSGCENSGYKFLISELMPCIFYHVTPRTNSRTLHTAAQTCG